MALENQFMVQLSSDVCVCALIVAILFLSMFPLIVIARTQIHRQTGMNMNRNEKTKTTKTATAVTHSIQGKAAEKQVFKFIERHYYSLIRLGSRFCIPVFLHAHSQKNAAMSA